MGVTTILQLPVAISLTGAEWIELVQNGTSVRAQVGASQVSAIGVQSFSAGTTGLTPAFAAVGDVVLAGTLVAANGGTGQSGYTAGDLLYASGASALSKLGIGGAGDVLTVSAGVPSWAALSTLGVTSFSAGTTGLTPSTSTQGDIVLAGTLGTANGGTGLTTFGAANRALYSTSASVLTAGTLPIAAGGTGSTTQNFVDLTTTQSSIAGAKTFTTQLIGKGTATNDNAATGYIGEFVQSSVAQGSAVALTTNTAANITSISLTAGDWNIWGNAFLAPGSGATATYWEGSISTTSATRPTAPNGGGIFGLPGSFTSSASVGQSVGTMRLSITTTTTVYLIAFALFTGGTASAFGSIQARRMR